MVAKDWPDTRWSYAHIDTDLGVWLDLPPLFQDTMGETNAETS